MPGSVLGLAALFIQYPAPKEAFAETVRVRTEAVVTVRRGKRDEAIRQLERWDVLTRKLRVGVFIRTGRMDSETVHATEALRERLEELRDAFLADDSGKVKQLLSPSRRRAETAATATKPDDGGTGVASRTARLAPPRSSP